MRKRDGEKGAISVKKYIKSERSGGETKKRGGRRGPAATPNRKIKKLQEILDKAS